jgi:hypothetical protein
LLLSFLTFGILNFVVLTLSRYFILVWFTVTKNNSPVLVGVDVVRVLEVAVQVGPGELDGGADLALVLTALLPFTVARRSLLK